MFTLLHGGVRNHRDGLLQSTVSKVRTTTPSPTLPTNQSIRLHCRPAGKGRWSQTVVLVVERFLRQTLLTCDSRSFNGCMKRESCRDSNPPRTLSIMLCGGTYLPWQHAEPVQSGALTTDHLYSIASQTAIMGREGTVVGVRGREIAFAGYV